MIDLCSYLLVAGFEFAIVSHLVSGKYIEF